MKIEYELAVSVYLAKVILWLKFAICWMIPWKAEEKKGKRRRGEERRGEAYFQ